MTPLSAKGAEILQAFANRRVAVLLPLGFASGLPLALSGGTLQMWLSSVDAVAVSTIGLFTLVGLPYTIKFLWAPFMDRFIPPGLGRRRGWILLTQVLLLLGIAVMATLNPDSPTGLWVLGALALFVAFASASQDVAFDAYRADILAPAERGFGASTSVLGYRIAMLASGAFGIILGDQIGYRNTYLIMAGLMTIGMATILFSPDPSEQPAAPRTLPKAYKEPLLEFLGRPAAIWLLLLIVLYKIGDAFAGSLTAVFLERGVGFSQTEIGLGLKVMGFGSVLLGLLIGASLMVRLGLFWSLLLFGVLQAVSNLVFVALAWVGKSYVLMLGAVAFENIAGGMGTAAFVAFLMGLCDHRFTATQYALLSAVASIGRVFVGPPSGFLVEAVGWGLFFLTTFLVALPGLWLLWRLRASVLEAPVPAPARP